MKSYLIQLLLCASIFALSSACDKTENLETLIGESDAAEILASVLAGEACGSTVSRTTQASQRATLATSGGNICTFNRDTAYTCANTVGTLSYNYNLATKSFITCQTIVPQSFTFIGSGTGSIEKIKISHQTTLRDTILVTGLQPSATNYTLQGKTVVTGTGTFKGVSENRTFTSTLNVQFNNVTINKTSMMLTGGTGQFTLSGSGKSRTYQFSGSLVFNGNGTATVTIGNRTFTIHLKTGEVV